ncbi:MAG TPA: GntR family transcriptional regulator [Povalibacter sp.]|uniref:GntR family transcriptional regulator n=1 Tax=Povalibacter sp. TaxID=1962978 RepID=UPI002CA0EDC2|nr:GntR family transcriptional regulator [Povalibacter sp.]HMN45198.1 GntR family transcriptional regulator [Povalibacter sp.]
MFVLNPQSGTPIYRQLVDQVTRLISGGQLTPGTELPSVRELAELHAVNPMTISKAYTLLETEGLLERQRGKPMRVATRRRNQAPLAQRLQQLEAAAAELALAARQLEIGKKELLTLVGDQWEKENG